MDDLFDILDECWGTKGRGDKVALWGESPWRIAVKQWKGYFYAVVEDSASLHEIRKERSLHKLRQWVAETIGFHKEE